MSSQQLMKRIIVSYHFPTDDNLFELRAYYDEPFDSSSVTEWNDDVKEAMLEHFGQFSTVVPFTYLGTQNYRWEFLDTGVKIGESSTVETTADEDLLLLVGFGTMKLYQSSKAHLHLGQMQLRKMILSQLREHLIQQLMLVHLQPLWKKRTTKLS